MRSLKIDNGDIVFDSLGKAIFVTDIELIKQSLNLRLNTAKTELFYEDEYGHPILKGKQTEESILNYLKDTLMQDERVREIEIITFNLIKTTLKVEAKIYLHSNESVVSVFNL